MSYSVHVKGKCLNTYQINNVHVRLVVSHQVIKICKFLSVYILCDFYPSITDVDECERGISGCQHICNNTVGGFNCFCNPGYTLNPDGKYCTGEC